MSDRRWSRSGGGRRSLVSLTATMLAAPLLSLTLLAAPASATTGTSVSVGAPTYLVYNTVFSVGVTVTASSGPAPTTGTLSIGDSFGDEGSCTALSSAGQASCEATYGSVGPDTITVTYSDGGGQWAGSSGSTSVTVAKASVTISISAEGATVGQSPTVSVQATPALGPNSSGAVTVSDSPSVDVVDCSDLSFVNGFTATCTPTAQFSAVGSDTIDASWAGNADYQPATAQPYDLEIGQGSATVESVTAAASDVGETASITVQMLKPYPDGGEVSVSDGDDEITGCASLPLDTTTGQASCTSGVLTSADSADVLSAQYLGDANFGESSVTTGTLDIGRGSTTLTLSATEESGTSVGATNTYIATVKPAASVEAGDTVAFSDANPPDRISDCGAEPVSATNDDASCTSLTYSAAGSDMISATYSGNKNWAPSSAEQSFGVAPGTPTVAVSLDPAQPTYGERVTVTATVSASIDGAPVELTGSFDFSGSYLSGCTDVALSANSASCTSAVLTSTEQWTVQAEYSGDDDYKSVTLSSPVTVSGATTTLALSSDPPNPQAFAADTLTAAVSPIPDGGSVTFSGPGGVLAGCNDVAVDTTDGKASCAVGKLPGAGSEDLSATYSDAAGDSDYQPSTGQLDLSIGQIPTTLGVTADPSSPQVGEDSVVTVTVAPLPDGGSVSVTDGLDELDCAGISVPTSGPHAGSVSCTTSELSPAGVDSLSASFTGSADYQTSTGQGAIDVQRDPSSTTITGDSYGVVGAQLHVTAHVSPIPSSGTVEFTDTLDQLGTCASVSVDPTTGTASCVSAVLGTSGADDITATFEQTATEGQSDDAVTIPIDQAPSFASPLQASVTVGTAAEDQLSVAGYPAPSITTTSTLPSGLSLSSAGVLSGTPASGSGGAYAIALEATNPVTSVTGTLELSVDEAPAISSPTSLTAAYGEPATFQILSAAGSYPLPSFTLTGALPDGMTLVDNGDGTATISGTPDDYVSGVQSFDVVLANSAGSLHVPFSIDVTGTPPAPSSAPAAPSSAGGSGGASPPATATPATTPGLSAGSGAALSPVSEALSLRRQSAVRSGGVKPVIATHVSLPATYDPIAPTRTALVRGRPEKVPVVVLGRNGAFPVLGNVGPYGDCAVVATSSIVRADHLAGRFGRVPKMTADEALSEWAALDGGSGAGLTDGQLLHAWAGPAGVLGTRLKGWSELDPQSLVAMKRAIVSTGALYATVVLPENLTLSSTIDPPITSTSDVGGHSLAVVGWTPRGFLVVTWGEVALVPYSWWERYAATAYAVNLVGSTGASTSTRTA